jgi:protein ImuB
MLWLAICLPYLSLEVFTRTLTPPVSNRIEERQKVRPPSGFRLPDGPAVAVCNHLRVLQSNEVAQIHGVHPGTKRATALALAPEIQLIDRAPDKELTARLRVAQWLLQFSPLVSLQFLTVPVANAQGQHSPLGVLVDISGSLKLFGGLQTLTTRIASGLMELGYQAQWACAPTPHGAWLLAQHQPACVVESLPLLNARLASVPLGLLSTFAQPKGVKQLDTLHGLGAHTLKDLAALPRPGIARRFGPELLDELDRALGRVPEPRLSIEVPRDFALKLELLAQVENAEALNFAGRRLLIELTAWLTVQHAGVRSFCFLAHHDSHPATAINIELAQASRDLARLSLLLRERLEKTQLIEAVHSLELVCKDVVSLHQNNQQLFPSPEQMQEGLGRLVERLQSKLGAATVQSMSLANDHRPENAYKLEPITKLPPSKAPKEPSSTKSISSNTSSNTNATLPKHNILPRPLWLLPQVISIGEQKNRPWYRSPLKLLAGPERIESGWWDDDLVQRDYFIAEDHEAVLYWIYRTRAVAKEQSEPVAQWFIQGVFG